MADQSPAQRPTIGKRPRATIKEVKASILALERYHAIGLNSLDECREPGYDKDVILRQAQQLNQRQPSQHWSDTKLRKARQFADLYSKQQLKELFALLRQHKPHFGTTHIGLLVILTAVEQREEIQKRAIEEDWSKSQLGAEIKMLHKHPQLQAGRKRRVSPVPEHALVQLADLTSNWQRWSRAVATQEAEQPGKDGRTQTVYKALPKKVRQAIDLVDQAFESLHDVVDEALDTTREEAALAAEAIEPGRPAPFPSAFGCQDRKTAPAY